MTIDPDGFDRALANVIDNALRYSPRGSAIDVKFGEDEDGAYVQVTDDGPGIPPELIPCVFEPMVRADSARNGGTGGTGLGLTIAARLLRNQGGDHPSGQRTRTRCDLHAPASHDIRTRQSRVAGSDYSATGS